MSSVVQYGLAAIKNILQEKMMNLNQLGIDNRIV